MAGEGRGEGEIGRGENEGQRERWYVTEKVYDYSEED